MEPSSDARALHDADVAAAPRSTPLYKEVKRRLMEALSIGEWRPGDAIPSEPRLATRYGISIGTVRKAIDELAAENILVRQQGRGTFVASHNRDRMLFYFFHVVPETGPKAYPEVEMLAFGRGRADALQAGRLGIAIGAPVFLIRNRLSLRGDPIIVDDIALPCGRFPNLNGKQFRERSSTIYNLYQESFGISVVRTSERLRATLGDGETTALLGIASGAPLLQIRRVAYTYHDEPVEYRVSLVNTARHEYWADIGAV